MQTADLAGRTLGGKYLLGELLGKGGWGAVYAATQTDLGRAVAIKVLHEGPLHSSDGLARFSREARAAAALGHPNIALVTDFQSNPGEPPFLVMERLTGKTLGAELKRLGRIPAPRLVWIAHQILSALGEAHAKGIIHRDVKPDNVFLVSAPGLEDHVKLLDFGIAKLADTSAAQLTATDTSLGSPAYMAPEQIRHLPIDARTDLYAVGATMYHALAGRFPFEAGNIHALLLTITEQRATPLSSVEPSIDAALSAIVDRAMSKDPAARFASAAEMRAALEPFVSQAARVGGGAPSAYGPPPTFGPATSPAASTTPNGPFAGTTGGIVPLPTPMPLSPPYGTSPPLGTPPPMMGGALPPMGSLNPASAPPMMAPAVSAPPGAMTGPPGYGPPVVPPAVPPLPAPPAKGSGAVIALLVVIVVLLLVVVGGAIAAFVLLRAKDEGPSASTSASGAKAAATTPPASASAPASSASAAVASTAKGVPGKPGADPIPNGPTPTAPIAALDAGPAPTTPDAGGVARKQMGGTKPYVGGGDFGKYDIDKSRASISAVMGSITQCYAATEFDAPDHQFNYYFVNVDPAGNVTSVAPVTDASNHAKLNPCLFAAIHRAKFQAIPGGGQIKLSFTARNRDNP